MELELRIPAMTSVSPVVLYTATDITGKYLVKWVLVSDAKFTQISEVLLKSGLTPIGSSWLRLGLGVISHRFPPQRMNSNCIQTAGDRTGQLLQNRYQSTAGAFIY